MKLLNKAEREAVYKSIWSDVNADLKESRKRGKELLVSEGITFAIFKGEVMKLLVVGDGAPNWHTLFNYYCEFVGDKGSKSVKDFAEFYFLDFKMSTHGIRLKSVPDDRL